MTIYEANAQLTFGVRFSVGGVQVHTTDLHYYEADGQTASADNINLHPYNATLQVGGHTISLQVVGSPPTAQTVAGRQYTISADAPFWAVFTSSLGVVVDSRYVGGHWDYDVTSDATVSTRRARKGGNSATCDLTADITTLWDAYTPSSAYPNKFTFGGVVFADIQWCTHLPVRDPQTGVLLRHPTTGMILRDD